MLADVGLLPSAQAHRALPGGAAMTWESVSIRLSCGCDGAGAFDATHAGDEQTCKVHGATTVHRVSRVRESAGSRNAQLVVKEGAE